MGVIKNQKQLAEHTGIATTRISNMKANRDNITNKVWEVISKKYEFLNEQFLIDGEGSVLKGKSSFLNYVLKSQNVTLIELANNLEAKASDLEDIVNLNYTNTGLVFEKLEKAYKFKYPESGDSPDQIFASNTEQTVGLRLSNAIDYVITNEIPSRITNLTYRNIRQVSEVFNINYTSITNLKLKGYSPTVPLLKQFSRHFGYIINISFILNGEEFGNKFYVQGSFSSEAKIKVNPGDIDLIKEMLTTLVNR